MPILSIITINYNNLEGLKRTVDSVVNQTWKEFEYIVVDGGSTDGSREFMESHYQDFDYWVSEPDKGVYNAMNKGIKVATGKYLLFLNSGDHFYSDSVLQENNGNLNNYDLVYFNLQIVGNGVSKIKHYPNKLSFSYLYEGHLPHPATFIKRTLYDIVGFYDENLKIVSDWKFFIESICKYSFSYVKVDQTLSTYYSDGMSSDHQNRELIIRERRQVLELNFSAYIVDITLMNDLKRTILTLKKSRKIKFLIKLGLLHKF